MVGKKLVKGFGFFFSLTAAWLIEELLAKQMEKAMSNKLTFSTLLTSNGASCFRYSISFVNQIFEF